MVQREVDVAQRLGLNALGRVDDEDRPVAGREGPRDLVVEVDVPRRVDQIECIFLTIIRLVDRADGLRLDCDAALALEIHVVEDLVLHFALG